ncbi:hypothetical protein Tco_1046243 [Tanacetum coccineum]
METAKVTEGCKPEGLELLDVAECCYNLTTKKLCVELQLPLAPERGAAPEALPQAPGETYGAKIDAKWLEETVLDAGVSLAFFFLINAFA